jgi:hypothetical protein
MTTLSELMVGLGAYETPNEVLSAIAPELKALVHAEAMNAGAKASKSARSSVITYSIIAGVVGVVGGGLLGLGLARTFR